MEGFENFNELAKAWLNFELGSSGDSNESDFTPSSNNCSTPLNFNELDFTDPFISDPQTVVRTKVVIGFYACICFVGLVANIGLIASLLVGGKQSTTMKAPSTILIVNLAIADTLLLLTLPFAIVQRWENNWRFGYVFCKFEESLKFLSYYGSVFFLTAMAADRYFMIFRGKTYERARARLRVNLVSIFIWVLAILVDIPIMVFSAIDERGLCNIIFPGTELPSFDDYGDLESLREGGDLEASGKNFLPFLCLDDLPTMADESVSSGEIDMDLFESFYFCSHPEAKSVKTWLTCNFIVGFVFPFAIISICYFNILRLKSSSSSQAGSGNTSKQSSSDESSTSSTPPFSSMQKIPKPTNVIIFNKRAKKILDILIPCLILAFLLCWLPYHVWHLARIDGVNVARHPCLWIQDVTFILAYSNSTFNPILNSLFLFNFKNRLRKSGSWLRKILNIESKSSCYLQEIRFKKENDQNSKSMGNITIISPLD